MTVLDRGLTMMHRAIGAPLCHTVLMEQGIEHTINVLLIANHYHFVFILKHNFTSLGCFLAEQARRGNHI